MDQRKAPLFEKMLDYKRLNPARFHVPGHKGRQSCEGDFKAEASYADILALDLTEVTDLDDLHQPDSVIHEAQCLAAACFGAEETFFLVNGSTAGNLAMVLAICEKDDLLLVQRNVHKSVINALMLAEARVVFLNPQMDESSRLAGGVASATVAQALSTYPDAKGVLLTNPNYYGMGSDMASVAAIAHEHGVPLLVDEAHGAHYGFHPELPRSALSCGADIVVQSTHKMLTAMTMGAMLHIQGTKVDRERVKTYLGMLQSSSPSYPIMASLDMSRRWLAVQGCSSLSQGLKVMETVRHEVRGLNGIGLLPQPSHDSAYQTLDPFKLTLYDRSGCLTGFQLKAELEGRGIMTEMADPHYVLLVGSLATTEEDGWRLVSALNDLHSRWGLGSGCEAAMTADGDRAPIIVATGVTDISAPIRMSRSAPFSAHHRHSVSIADLAGKISAEMIIPYPPGIPLVYPGERITQAVAEQIGLLAASGAKFQGVRDISLQRIDIWV